MLPLLKGEEVGATIPGDEWMSGLPNARHRQHNASVGKPHEVLLVTIESAPRSEGPKVEAL